MAICSIETLKWRAAAATKESQLAVFSTGTEGMYRVVFDSTIMTKRDIAKGYGYLDSVYRESSLDKIIGK